MDKDRLKKQAIFKKFVRLGRIAWQRDMDRKLERGAGIEEPQDYEEEREEEEENNDDDGSTSTSVEV